MITVPNQFKIKIEDKDWCLEFDFDKNRIRAVSVSNKIYFEGKPLDMPFDYEAMKNAIDTELAG